jgi:ATP-dependent Clp protease ATP-binding subunit ClpX
MKSRRQDTCAFCGKPGHQVRQLVAGPGASICDQCVEVCRSLIESEQAPAGKSPRPPRLKVPRPHEIKEFLDRYVIGHDYTKKVLSVAVHNHYKRADEAMQGAPKGPYADVELEKSNVVLIGPTGCGKTLLARTLARLLDVPFAITDATTLTEAGYVGEDVENILLALIQNADGDIQRAEHGIIYVDEIDKIGRKTENVSITRDVSGEGVQQALLKILEGTMARVPPGGGRKHPQQKYIEINTQHILFICGGAFVGLDAIVKRRIGERRVGFLRDEQDDGRVLRGPGLPVEPEDLVRYGLIPELIGRLPVVAALSDLTEDDLVRILTEPRNCMVRQYQKLLAMEGIELSFTDGALRELARQAAKRGMGARGLRALVETLMLDVMFEAPRMETQGRMRVTETMVKRREPADGTVLKALKIA